MEHVSIKIKIKIWSNPEFGPCTYTKVIIKSMYNNLFNSSPFTLKSLKCLSMED